MDDINKQTYKYRMDPSGSLRRLETINSKNNPFESNAYFNQKPQRLSGAQSSNYRENPFRTSTQSSAERAYVDHTGSQRNFDRDVSVMTSQLANQTALKQYLDYAKSQGTFGVDIKKYRERLIEKDSTEVNPYDPYGSDEMGQTKSHSRYDNYERYNQKRNTHNPQTVVDQNPYDSKYLIDKTYEQTSTSNPFSKNANVDPYADIDPYAGIDPYADEDPYGYIKRTSTNEKSHTSNQSISYSAGPQRRHENESYTQSDSDIDDNNIDRYTKNYENDRNPRHRSSSIERDYTDRNSYRYPTYGGSNFEEDRRESRALQRTDENESYTESGAHIDDVNIDRYSTNYEYDRSPRHRSSSTERNCPDRDSYRYPTYGGSNFEEDRGESRYDSIIDDDRDSYRCATYGGLNVEEDRRESRYESFIEDEGPSSSYMQKSFSDYSKSDYRRRRSPSVEKFDDKHDMYRSRPPHIENVEISSKKISFTPQRQNPKTMKIKPNPTTFHKARKPNNPYNKRGNPKKMKTTQPDKNQVKLKLAVVNKQHPQTILTEKQANLIQNNLIQAIDNLKTRDEEIPRFDDTHYSFGALWVTCANEYSKNWLKQTISDFKPLLDGCELDINERLVPKRIVKPPRILMKLQITDSEKAVRRRLEIQNPKLNTENWVLVDMKFLRDIKTVVFNIDEQSYGILGECKFRPFYNFGRITCRPT